MEILWYRAPGWIENLRRFAYNGRRSGKGGPDAKRDEDRSRFRPYSFFHAGLGPSLCQPGQAVYLWLALPALLDRPLGCPDAVHPDGSLLGGE